MSPEHSEQSPVCSLTGLVWLPWMVLSPSAVFTEHVPWARPEAHPLHSVTEPSLHPRQEPPSVASSAEMWRREAHRSGRGIWLREALFGFGPLFPKSPLPVSQTQALPFREAEEVEGEASHVGVSV